MDKPVNVNDLCQQWMHSREEDTSTEAVYRPATYSFPSSRGRAGFEFSADGTFKRLGIGPTDVSAVSQGTWRIEDETSKRLQIEVEGAPQILEVKSLGRDRLTIGKT